MHNQNVVDIDLDVLTANVTNIRTKYDDYKYYIGVIKGNAYGHGFGIVATLVAAGINYIAVSSLEEALATRKQDADIPILIMEPVCIEELFICQEHRFTITISSKDYFHDLLVAHKKQNLTLNIHVKLDTGLNRLGIDNRMVFEGIYEQLKQEEKAHSGLVLEGIFTHFATTGVLDSQFDDQMRAFGELTQNIDLSTIPIIHLGRSATLETRPKIPVANGIRMGAILFGINQTFRTYGGMKGKLREVRDDYRRKKLNLSPTYRSNSLVVKTAFALRTPVMEINPLKAGEKVGYGGTYTATEDTFIAVCPIGYADGLHLELRHSHVRFGSKTFPIVGIINMCMITVQVDASVQVGDMMTLIGDGIDIKNIARLTRSTAYVVVTQVNPQIKRNYKGGPSHL